VRHSQADISKAKKLLKYEPSHKIDIGLEEAMDWYVENLLIVTVGTWSLNFA